MNKPDSIGKEQLRDLATSTSVRQFGPDIVKAAAGHPILDAPCGTGRDSAWLSYIGGRIIAADIALREITKRRDDPSLSPFADAFRRITLMRLDLINDAWPFSTGSIGGVINIHFLHLPLLPRFAESMIVGGYLVCETVEARGGNYFQLPKAGVIYKILSSSFQFLEYKERQVGPVDTDAVTVKLVAKKLPAKSTP